MGTLGAKTSQWRLGHVPYLPYARYATGTSMQVAHVKQERFTPPPPPVFDGVSVTTI